VRVRRSRPFVLLRIAVVGAVVYALTPSRVAITIVEDGLSSDITGSRTSTAYVLEGDRWALFSLPPLQEVIKVVSNASVPSHFYQEEDLTCEYALRYQIIDLRDHVVRDQTVGLRGGALNYKDEETGEIYPAQSYLGLGTVPLCSRTTMISLKGLADEAFRLRLSLGVADPRVSDVIVRVYHNDKPQPYKLRYLWQRLSVEKRERLARANVYGPDLLTDWEKQNLLENRWIGLAPQGIHGRNYFERKLYSLKVRERSTKAEGILPRGLFVSAAQPGTVPVPQGLQCLRFEFQRLEAKGGLAVVFLDCYRADLPEKQVTESTSDEASWAYRAEYDGGLLELEASEDVVVRVFVEGQPEEVEITPDLTGISGYLLEAGAPVEFRLVNPEGGRTALRLDVRRLYRETDGNAERVVSWRYELLDGSRRQLAAGSIADVHLPSRYDRIAGELRAARVSDPARRYVCLPPACVSVRLYSNDESVYVSGYTRPFDLSREVEVPESYMEFEKGQLTAKNWFPIRPENYVECLVNEREVFFKTQTRPRQPADYLLGGAYDVEACEPLDSAGAYNILTAVERLYAGSRTRTNAYFLRLPPGEAQRVELRSELGGAMVEPRLLYLGEDDAVSTLRVFVDGRLQTEVRQASRSNEVVLAPIPSGAHEMRIEGPPGGRVYLNRIAAAREEGLYLERTVHWLGEKKLSYELEKKTAESESICLRLYAPAPANESVLRLELAGAHQIESLPVSSWTFRSTRYRVRPGAAQGIEILGSQPLRLCGGELFLLTLGADLGPGRYRLDVSLEGGAPGFLQVAQIIPGEREERRVFGQRAGSLGEGEE